MNTLHYVLSVAWKELQLLGKDRGALGIFFLLPILIGSLSAAPSAMTMNAAEQGEAAILVRVALVNQDGGAFGSEIEKAIGNIKELQVTTFSDSALAEEQVSKGESSAAILIPADFSQKIDAHQPTQIEVLVDPAAPESASIVSGIMNQVVAEVTIWGEVQYGVRSLLASSGLLENATAEQQRGVIAQSQGAFMIQLNEIRSHPAISVVSETQAGATPAAPWQPLYITYIFAGFTVMFIFFIVGATAETLLVERETGVLRRLLSAPIPPGAVIAGKMLAYMVVVCLQVVVLFGLASLAFGIPLGHSPLGLVLLTVAVALTATSMGVMLAALARSSKQASSLGMVLGFVLAGLGGAVAINPGMMFFRSPGFMGFLANLTPHAHAVSGFYRLMAEDAPLRQVLPDIGILLGMSAIFYLIARWRFRFV